MSNDAVHLTNEEAEAVAWRLAADHLCDTDPSWLLWENLPSTDEDSFQRVCDVVIALGDYLRRIVDASRIDSNAIIKEMQK